MYKYEYPRPSVTADIVVFGFKPNNGNRLKVILIRRGGAPFKGSLAVPGGFVGPSESTQQAAFRELQEEVGIRPDHLEQLYTFSEPGRDPRGWIITVAHFALVRADRFHPQAGDDAAEAEWWDVNEALNQPLAFDHRAILEKALERLAGKVRYTPIGFDLLPRRFTMAELRKLYETLLGRSIDVSNFRKKILALDILVETGEVQTGSHRPAPLYRFNKARYEALVKNGISFEI